MYDPCKNNTGGLRGSRTDRTIAISNNIRPLSSLSGNTLGSGLLLANENGCKSPKQRVVCAAQMGSIAGTTLPD